MNVKQKTKKEMNINLQNLEERTKLKFHQDFRSSYVEMYYLRQSENFHSEEDTPSEKAEGVVLMVHEARSLLSFSRPNHRKNIKL